MDCTVIKRRSCGRDGDGLRLVHPRNTPPKRYDGRQNEAYNLRIRPSRLVQRVTAIALLLFFKA